MDNDGGWYCLHPSCSCHASSSLPCRCGKDGAQCMIHNPPFPTNAERTGDKGLVMTSGVVGKAPKLNEPPSIIEKEIDLWLTTSRTIDQSEKEANLRAALTRVYESGFKHGAKHEGSYEVAFKAGHEAKAPFKKAPRGIRLPATQ